MPESNASIYIDFIKAEIMPRNPDAFLWLCAYGIYCHAIDDIVDKEIPKNKPEARFMLEQFEFAEVVYSNHFYIANTDRLRPLVKMASNAYMDSIMWEGDKEVWKKQVSDHLRQMGNEVCLAVFEIVGGVELRNRLSPKLREIAYKCHHKETGEPI